MTASESHNLKFPYDGLSRALQSYQIESTVTPIHICRDSRWIFYVTTLSCERDENIVLRPTSGCPDDGNVWEQSSGNQFTGINDTLDIILDCGENVMQDGLCLEEEILSHLPDYCPAPTVLEGGQCRTYAYEVSLSTGR